MTNAFPSFSIVIETANLEVAAIERLEASLDSIAQQVPSPALAKEVVLLDAGGLPPDLLARLLARHPWLTTRRISGGTDYGDQKAASAISTSGEIMVLADSDCLYEAGWLAAILETFAEHPEIEALAGETAVAIRGPFTLAIALIFFFPRFSYETRIAPARGFYGNNVAFRRSVFSKLPFPEGLPIERGQNVVYSRMLARAGVTIWRQPRARSDHAPPEGLWMALIRLFSAGRDSRKLVSLERSASDDPFIGDFEPYGKPGGRIAKSLRRVQDILRQQPAMLLWLPIAGPIALVCAGAFFAGRALEKIQPSA